MCRSMRENHMTSIFYNTYTSEEDRGGEHQLFEPLPRSDLDDAVDDLNTNMPFVSVHRYYERMLYTSMQMRACTSIQSQWGLP